MERKVYITLGVLSLIAPFIISFFIFNETKTSSLVITFMSYLGYAIINMLYNIFNGYDLDYNFLFFFWPLTLGRKKIYYSELGYFYISFKKDKVKVFKQTSFNSKFLFDLTYSGDNEHLSSRIKANLDDIYKENLRAKNIKNSFKKWDGYIDKKSKRDDKLNQLL
jgi:hypothetical protein